MTRIRKVLPIAGLFGLLGLSAWPLQAQDYQLPEGTPEHIQSGVQSPRAPEQVARDAERKPAELLSLAGLEEGDRIAELSAFGQYFSDIIAVAIGPTGHLYMYDMPYMEQFGDAVAQGRAFAQRHDNVDYTLVHYNDIELPGELDAVYNILFYHDLQPQEVDTAALNARIYAALKPGGSYLVVDHRAEEGSGWRDAATIHRMAKETIVEEVSAAGFELAEDSDLLANPEDDRSAMVFAPGTRGHTDQAVLLFRKPE